MKKTKKKLLGFLGLIVVVVMTIFAHSIPTPGAGAVSSITDTIIVHVYDKYPKITITAPENDEILIGPNHAVSYDWENSTSADFILTYDGATVTTWHEDYAPFGPSEHTAGTGSHDIALNEYGKYILTSTATGPIGTFEDSVVVYRLATKISYLEADENNDPIFKINYDDIVKEVELRVYDSNGHEIFPEAIIVETLPGGELRYTLVMPEGSESGRYKIVAKGLDEDGEEISDAAFAYFDYEAPAPDIPDTGFVLEDLNIASSDFLITGLIVFFAATFAAIFILNRKKER